MPMVFAFCFSWKVSSDRDAGSEWVPVCRIDLGMYHYPGQHHTDSMRSVPSPWRRRTLHPGSSTISWATTTRTAWLHPVPRWAKWSSERHPEHWDRTPQHVGKQRQNEPDQANCEANWCMFVVVVGRAVEIYLLWCEGVNESILDLDLFLVHCDAIRFETDFSSYYQVLVKNVSAI